MSAEVPSNFAITLTLSDVAQPVPLPKKIVVSAELTYPADYHPDRDVMVDQLLRNASIYQTSPFALIKETEEKLSAENSSIIHEKISYELEPKLPGKYALTFYEIPFIPNDVNSKERENVVSPILYVDVVLPEAATLNLSAEVAPMSTLSERIPIELNSEIRAYISQDQSSHNTALFRNKELPWDFVLGLLFLLFILSGTFLIYKFSKKKKPVKQTINEIIPLVEAENLLNQLKMQSLLDSSVVKDFISQIISSLRNYLELNYGISASALTTQEFLREVEMHSSLNVEKKESVKEVFRLADQIKFGGYKPTLEECVKILGTTQKIPVK